MDRDRVIVSTVIIFNILCLRYQWTQGFATTVGYRYLDVDYEKGGFMYDIAQDGMTIGLPRRF